MQLTHEQLQAMIPKNKHCEHWLVVLNQLLPEYEINTASRVAAFIAQCAHESAEFTQLIENLNYRWQSLRRVFPKYFPNDELAQQYASRSDKQQAIANRIYANRMGNGDEASGDGYRFRGKGLIQLTGRSNVTWFGASLEITPEEASEYLETFEGAVQGACWFWETNKLNTWADQQDILTLTKRINGGTIGLEDRKKHYQHALHVLGA